MRTCSQDNRIYTPPKRTPSFSPRNFRNRISEARIDCTGRRIDDLHACLQFYELDFPAVELLLPTLRRSTGYMTVCS